MKLLAFTCLLATLAGSAGCVGGPKEATDPSTIMGADLDQGGVESTGAASPRPDPQTVPSARKAPPPEVPATRAECERATRHIQELGIDLAINTETDPAKKKKMADTKADTMASPEMQQKIKQGTEECLQRETSQREARCIAKIRSERDIDACVH